MQLTIFRRSTPSRNAAAQKDEQPRKQLATESAGGEQHHDRQSRRYRASQFIDPGEPTTLVGIRDKRQNVCHRVKRTRGFHG